MILCHDEITQALLSGDWQAYSKGKALTPNDLTINPNSIDVSIGRKFKEPILSAPRYRVDLHDPDSISWEDYEADEQDMNPGDFLLGHTNERIDCTAPLWIDGKHRYFVPMIEGRSTVARCSLSPHQCAGFGDVGFNSSWTLEITTVLPFLLRADDRIAQVFFIEASSGTVKYNGAYTDQHDGPRAPVLGKERFR